MADIVKISVESSEETRVCNSCNLEKPITSFAKIMYKGNWKGNRVRTCNSCKYQKTKAKTSSKDNRTKLNSIPVRQVTALKPTSVLNDLYQLYDPNIYRKWIDGQEDSIVKQSLINMRNAFLGDSGSWAVREFHALRACGYQGSIDIHGPDGYDQNGTPVEVKTSWAAADSDSYIKGSGSFNDAAEDKLERLVRESWKLVHAFYIGHRLITAIQIPITYEPFHRRLEECLNKTTGRSKMDFSISHYINCPDLEWLVLPSVGDLLKYQKRIPNLLLNKIGEQIDNSFKGRRSSDID